MQKAVFVSVLKPVDDIRLFQKIAQTWRKADYQIHSIGFEASIQNTPHIFFYPIFKFKRLHIKRLFAGFLMLYYLLKIRPKHIICGSVEILPFCIFFKICTLGKTKVFYDIQENYYLNILHTKVYFKLLRYPLAWLVRLVEWCCSLFINYFFLAEQCYAQELPFLKNRFLILENKPLKKFFEETGSSSTSNKFALVGTIAEEYGVWEAISFFEQFQLYSSHYQLFIHGKCAKKDIYEKLINLQDKHIFCKISENPMPYEAIIETMKLADAILMPYEVNKSYEKRIPTKFYEAMALNKWIVVSENLFWVDFFRQINYSKVIFLDFKKTDIQINDVVKTIQKNIDYQHFELNMNLFWEHEELKLQEWLQK